MYQKYVDFVANSNKPNICCLAHDILAIIDHWAMSNELSGVCLLHVMVMYNLVAKGTQNFNSLIGRVKPQEFKV